MTKALAVVVFLVGLIGYVGVFSYQKVISLSFASGSRNYYEGSKYAVSKNIMTLKSCDPGFIPFLAKWQGKIEIEPNSVTLEPTSKVRIVNGDSTPHTIGINGTKLWQAIEPGNAIELTYLSFPKAGDWGITCDGINLGEKSPLIDISDGI